MRLFFCLLFYGLRFGIELRIGLGLGLGLVLKELSEFKLDFCPN